MDARIGTDQENQVQAEFLARHAEMEVDASEFGSSDSFQDMAAVEAEEESEVDAGEGSGATGVIGEGV